MIKKLNIKLTIIYGFIIITTIALLNFLVIYTYQKKRIEKTEIEYTSYSHIVADLAKDNYDNIVSFNKKIKDLSNSYRSRILVINEKKMVIADSSNEYIGFYMSNNEIKQAYNNLTDIFSYYSIDNKNIMALATPILDRRQPKGAVLFLTDLSNVYSDINIIKIQTIVFSVIACIFAVILSLYFGKKITDPIEELISASEMILKGNLNTRVNINRKDEIGKLATTFNKMSEELYKIDKNRRQFLSDVSHELKTPLSSIKALIESLIDSGNDVSIYDEYLNDVNEEIDRLSTLVKSLLTVTRLEELELKLTRVSLYDEVATVGKLFKSIFAEKNITFYNNCSKEVAVLCDKNSFRKVLINLIDNSVKYGKENSFIEIKSVTNKEKTLIIVKDNGIGIPESKLPYIFDNLYRVDESRNKKTEGYGIGLFIVKKIVELHGWKIKVKSELGYGTEFIIEINN